MVNWHEHIDIYCERTSPDIWSEPLNAITNLSFFVAAWFAYRIWQKSPNKGAGGLFLIFVMVLVGAGSFLFHTLATRWSMLADMLPIALFIYYGLFMFLYRCAQFRMMHAVLGVVAYIGFSFLWQKYVPPEFLNRSAQYIPALIMLIGFGVWSRLQKLGFARYFLMAAAVFVVSLMLRSFDMQICQYFPYGVHFMWHILNGLVLYLVAKGLLRPAR